ncbi:MAG TPA: ABC transporter permease [Candidatus Nanoarchaeia archaeon]|nr:ABC transporter permease [Candidatus Pacearchaeota archaeon]HLC87325.1 ABC transporter permease [Candidatus Nanoarchaeia archaeon]
MIQDYFTLAVRNLRKKKLRSSLTIIGIFISIATIFVLISLSIGLDSAVKEQFRQLGSDKFFIMPRGQAGPPGAGGAVQLTVQEVNVIEKVNGVKAVSYDTIGNAKVEFNDEARYLMIIGIPLESSEVFIETGFYKSDNGRLLKKGDTGKIMIGSRFKETLYNKPVKIGNKLLINNKEFEVVGILQTIGNSQDDSLIFMSIEDFKDLFNSKDRVDQIIVQIKSGQDINKVADTTRRKLISFRDVTEKTRDFEIQTPEELLRSFGTVLNIITAFLLGVAGISLLVGSIGIANTMYTSVLERTKEIGVMKAIGAKNSDVLYIFVIESGILGLVGGAIGIFFGIGVGKIIEYIAVNQLGINLLKVVFPWYLIVGCLLFAFVIGSLSGLLPARQGSKLKPADTLRHE